MKQHILPILCVSILVFSQSSMAAGVGTRVERRTDTRQNTADRVDDKQKSTGPGPELRMQTR